MQPIKYDLYPSNQLSIARNDAQQYIANVSLPLTATVRQDIENYLTSFNRRMLNNFFLIINQLNWFYLEYGTAKIVYVESLNTYQTRFYLVVKIILSIIYCNKFWLFSSLLMVHKY